MTTIDTSAMSQVASKQGPGRDKTQTDGDGKGHGKFADAFASVGAASDAADHQPHASRALSDEAAAAEGGRSSRSIGHKSAASHRSGFSVLAEGARSIDNETETGLANGRAQSADADRSSADDPADAEPAQPVDTASTGETAGYDNLLSMLTSAASIEADPANSTASTSSLDADVAALAQVSQGGKGAVGGRADDPARRSSETANVGRVAATAEGLVEADAEGNTDADQIFRLVRADGKARPVEMAISGNGEATAAKDNAGAKFEAVTILDSRRYIGLAQTGNSAAVTAAIAQDPSWAAALTEMADKGPDLTGKVVNTLKIQLHPIDLGLVTATLRLQGDTLMVDLKVETGKAYRNLSDDQDAIVKALRGHGFSVDQISVQLTSSSDRSGGAGQGDAQAQFSGQQQAREGGGDRQSGGGARFANTMDPNEGAAHDNGHPDTLPAGQRRSAGGVYL